ncbi:MAG: recombination regulator RecX, partial [Betaproteobacteria bacterium]|nr:recombination regulator RecX [Betaproteobacteria bacterium]
MKPALQPSLKARALRLISMREHSRTELVRKLARFEEQP